MALVLAAVLWSVALTTEVAPEPTGVLALRIGEARRVEAAGWTPVSLHAGVVGRFRGRLVVVRPLDDPGARLVQVERGRLRLGGRSAWPGRVLRVTADGRLAFGPVRATPLTEASVAGRLVAFARFRRVPGVRAGGFPGSVPPSSADTAAADGRRREIGRTRSLRLAAEARLGRAATAVALASAPLRRDLAVAMALDYGDAADRARVMRGLVVSEVVIFAEILRTALDDPETPVVEAALVALVRAGDLDAIDVLSREAACVPPRLDPALVRACRARLDASSRELSRRLGAESRERSVDSAPAAAAGSETAPVASGRPGPAGAVESSRPIGPRSPAIADAASVELAIRAAPSLAAGAVSDSTIAASLRALAALLPPEVAPGLWGDALERAFGAWLEPRWPESVRLRAFAARVALPRQRRLQELRPGLATERGVLGFAAAAAEGDASRVRAAIEVALARPRSLANAAVLEAFAERGRTRLDLETGLVASDAELLSRVPPAAELAAAWDRIVAGSEAPASLTAALDVAVRELGRAADLADAALEQASAGTSPEVRVLVLAGTARQPTMRSLDALAAALDLEVPAVDHAVLAALATMLGSGGRAPTSEDASVALRARALLRLLEAALVFPGGR